MAKERDFLSTEIVNRGVEDSGPYAGSPTFSIKVHRSLPNFLTSVNLKYVRLGYTYLLTHAFYFLSLLPLLTIIVFTQWNNHSWPVFHFTHVLFLVLFFGLCVYIYLDLSPRSVYLVDFACFRPPDHLQISKEEFIELARKSGNFSEASLGFKQRVLKNSGIGNETYMPRTVFREGYRRDLKDGREEAAMVLFGAIDDLLAGTKIRPKDIKILVVNCGVLNTTPSLASMIINHYKLRHNINSFNLGGMGCAAGLIAIDLAKDLLNAYPSSYALVVSTEVVSFSWYAGNDTDMLLPNCFFRMGASAVLLSSFRLDRWRSKYELKQLVRTHKGMEDRSFECIHVKEDAEGKQGLSVSKEVIELGGQALKANITTLSPLVLPVSEQLHFFSDMLFGKKKKPYIPDYKLAFEHICILATSKKVLDEIQNNLELTEEYMEASRKTLEKFGNTSSSSIWYELAYLEAKSKIKKGDRIWQVAFGSGMKSSSGVWKALKTVDRPKLSPWIEESA